MAEKKIMSSKTKLKNWVVKLLQEASYHIGWWLYIFTLLITILLLLGTDPNYDYHIKNLFVLLFFFGVIAGSIWLVHIGRSLKKKIENLKN